MSEKKDIRVSGAVRALALFLSLSLILALSACALPRRPKDYDELTFAWPWSDKIGEDMETLAPMMEKLGFVYLDDAPNPVPWRTEPPEIGGVRFREGLMIDRLRGDMLAEQLLMGVMYASEPLEKEAASALYEKILSSLTAAYGASAPKRASWDPDYGTIVDYFDLAHETWLLDTSPDYPDFPDETGLSGPYGYPVKIVSVSLREYEDDAATVHVTYGISRLNGTDIAYLEMDAVKPRE